MIEGKSISITRQLLPYTFLIASPKNDRLSDVMMGMSEQQEDRKIGRAQLWTSFYRTNSQVRVERGKGAGIMLALT